MGWVKFVCLFPHHTYIMTDEFERIWEEVVMTQLQQYPSIHLEALRKSR
jgi:hypothetical protein